MLLSSQPFTGFLTPGDERWTYFLGKVRHDLFHLPGYARACAAAEGGVPLLYVLDAGTRGMLVPLLRRSLAPFGAAYRNFWDAVSPYGYPGPLYWGTGAEIPLAAMHRRFAADLGEAGAVSLFLRMHPFLGVSEPVLQAQAGLGELRALGPVVYMDLRDPDPDSSWNGINASNRRVIRHLLGAGCRVAIDRWETLDQVVMAYHDTMRRHDAPACYRFPPVFFRLLRQGAGAHLHLATAWDPAGEVMGGVLFSEVGGLIQYFLTGSFEPCTGFSPGKLLVNALRLWGLEHGCHTLNLGGGLGAREDSLFTFKFRLSKRTAPFRTLRKVILAGPYRALSVGRDDGDDYFPCYWRPEREPVAAGTAG